MEEKSPTERWLEEQTSSSARIRYEREFEFTEEALDALNTWEKQMFEKYVLSVDDEEAQELRATITGRCVDYAFKIAALYEVDSKVSKLVKLVKTFNSPFDFKCKEGEKVEL